MKRDAAPAQPGGASARSHRDAGPCGQPHDRRHFLRPFRPDDHIGIPPDVAEREFVMTVVLDLLPVGDDILRADDGG